MKKEHIGRLLLLSLAFFLSLGTSAAEFSDSVSCRKVLHNLGAGLRPSYIMSSHGFYNGYNPLGKPLKAGGSVHLQYSFSYPQDDGHAPLWPMTSQGIGLSLTTLGSHELLGTPLSIYLFQNVPFIWISEGFTIDYEWNLGLSAGWRTRFEGEPNGIIGSSANIFINVAALASWHTGAWTFSAGPGYTHFSNGDTTFPNGGANTWNLQAGLTRHFGTDAHEVKRPEAPEWIGDIVYDLVLHGAFRADRMLNDSELVMINRPFAVSGINFNPLYRFNRYLSAGASLDIMYDRSANLILEGPDDQTFSYPDISRQLACGISLRGELAMPIFSVNIGAGYNFLHSGTDLKGLYAMFALKAFTSDKLFIHIGYRLSSVLYAHNLMLGLGWRFGS